MQWAESHSTYIAERARCLRCTCCGLIDDVWSRYRLAKHSTTKT